MIINKDFCSSYSRVDRENPAQGLIPFFHFSRRLVVGPGSQWPLSASLSPDRVRVISTGRERGGPKRRVRRTKRNVSFHVVPYHRTRITFAVIALTTDVLFSARHDYRSSTRRFRSRYRPLKGHLRFSSVYTRPSRPDGVARWKRAWFSPLVLVVESSETRISDRTAYPSPSSWTTGSR